MYSNKDHTHLVEWNQESVIFDIDGVLANFVGGFTALARELYGPSVKRINTVEQKLYGDYGGMSKEQVEGTWAVILQSKEFWRYLPCEEETWPVLARVFKLMGYGVPVYFVSNRAGVEPIWQTQWWLNTFRHFDLEVLTSPNVILTRYKGEVAKAVNAKFCIEDKAENAWCVAWLSKGTKSYLLDRQYNRTDFGALSVIRTASVGAFLDDVEAYFYYGNGKK